jgi:hypothetical protein
MNLMRCSAIFICSISLMQCAQTAEQELATGSVQEFQDAIPIEVAEALFGFGDGSPMRVYAGLMEGFPAFELPAQFEIIGSLDRTANLSVALGTSLEEQEARTLITQALLREGWIEMPSFEPGMRDYGFVSVNQIARPSYSQLCHDDFGNLTILYRERNTTNTLTLSTSNGFFGNRYQTCEARIQQQQMTMEMSQRHTSEIYDHVPTLIAPEDANHGRMAYIGGGGMSSNGNSVETSTSFSIDWELDAVYSHFKDQIVEQGWTVDVESIGTVTANGTWIKVGDNNVNLILRLDVVNSVEDQFDLTLRVEGPGGRRGSGVFIGR